MPFYDKLVRDSIPAIIGRDGKNYSTRILETQEFQEEVKKKLEEELIEYRATANDQDALEELADLLELIHAAAEIHGASFEELEEIRAKKAAKRGGFKERIFLIEVEDDKT
ncbi:nucleoside triphosphate pyrophosphohydrolase [Planococcus lenghuensis]|uniref:Phosphoribosyl-ATP pyrophosphohydrolase n=1 Tax=Planococcus lenghuensis TaxID=2213202 RepID=A0A1Q2L2U8_9BACL|nr:nucleoside triphosphate pyrophosphohydrolase [Planococcus lenghuensis]AQQ54761.1 phosphoribosyl-ATP pyrophosphohydrolase [Planococcus lenghuensis]